MVQEVVEMGTIARRSQSLLRGRPWNCKMDEVYSVLDVDASFLCIASGSKIEVDSDVFFKVGDGNLATHEEVVKIHLLYRCA